MEETQYLPEEELVEKVQSGEYGWLEYINHSRRGNRKAVCGLQGQADGREHG